MGDEPGRRGRLRTGRAVSALLLGASLCVLPAAVAAAPAAGRGVAATPVVGTRLLGHSVLGRPIVAYHLGDPSLPRVSLLLGEMHGDEPAGVTVADALIHGRRSVEGINLWIVPTMNPDGYAAGTRGNAHGVDLNRNWRDKWTHLSGEFYSGPRPWSEPETRAMHRFLLRVRPHYIVSLHQPLGGVDTTDGGRLDPAFRHRLVRELGLPPKAFRCWSVCHGSMTGWYTTHRFGIGETVEFGGSPSHSYLVGRAARGIVVALGGHFGSLARHNPRSKVWARGFAGRLRVGGWSYDVDARSRAVAFTVAVDGRRVGSGIARIASPDLDARHRLSGGHRLRVSVRAQPGPHRVCLTFTNLGAGTRDPSRCVTAAVPEPTGR